ncbi:divalent-cation tolerance protein CutA [bacterium]|nr:divalent-cation tolerance protein CutA [bacterium]
MPALVQVQTTFASHDDAAKVAREVVQARLAACAQILPGVHSIYIWEDQLHQESEVLLLLKTTESTWPDLRDRLAKLHPYDTPEIIATTISHASFEYAAWLRESCRR